MKFLFIEDKNRYFYLQKIKLNMMFLFKKDKIKHHVFIYKR